jgi:hypothetical protein
MYYDMNFEERNEAPLCAFTHIQEKLYYVKTFRNCKLSVASLPCKMNWIFCSRDCQPQLRVHVGDWLQTTAPHKKHKHPPSSET